MNATDDKPCICDGHGHTNDKDPNRTGRSRCAYEDCICPGDQAVSQMTGTMLDVRGNEVPVPTETEPIRGVGASGSESLVPRAVVPAVPTAGTGQLVTGFVRPIGDGETPALGTEINADIDAGDGTGGERPAKADAEADWVDYAVSQGADREEAEGMTKADLIEEYGN